MGLASFLHKAIINVLGWVLEDWTSCLASHEKEQTYLSMTQSCDPMYGIIMLKRCCELLYPNVAGLSSIENLERWHWTYLMVERCHITQCLSIQQWV